MTPRITLILLLSLLLPPSAVLANHGGLPDPLPDELGEWAVGHRQSVIVDADRGDRPLPLRVWYPVDPGDEASSPAFYALILGLGITSQVASEGPPVSSRRKRPLIVFSHGSGGFNIQSIQLCETLASHGFIVAAPDHTGNTVLDFQNGTNVPFEVSARDRPLDIRFVIGHLIKRSRTAGDAFEGRVRGHRVGVAGHSFGGYTALAMASGWQDIPPDPRVAAIMPIAPASSILSDAELQSIQSPTMLLSGTFDTTTPVDPETIRPHALIGAASVYRADIVGAGHFHFANICDIASVLIGVGIGPAIWPLVGADSLVDPYFETCVPPAFPLDTAQRIQDLYAVSFFRQHLLSDDRYGYFLTEDYAEQHEPDVLFFGSFSRCGLGFEVAFVLVPMWAIRKTRKRKASRTSVRSF